MPRFLYYLLTNREKQIVNPDKFQKIVYNIIGEEMLKKNFRKKVKIFCEDPGFFLPKSLPEQHRLQLIDTVQKTEVCLSRQN